MKKIINSIRKNFRSYTYALNGIWITLKQENNFKIHILGGLIAIFLSFYLEINSSSWVIITTMIGLVLSIELLNTAIEKLADIVQPNKHPEIGIVKDIAAGAVFIISITSLIVGIIIFGGRLI